MAQFGPVQEEFQKAGAEVLFVAAEKREGLFKPVKYLKKNPVAFPFLLDEDRAVTKAYGVYHRLGADAFNIARPATFVVGRDGSIRFSYVGKNQYDRAPMESILEAARAAQR